MKFIISLLLSISIGFTSYAQNWDIDLLRNINLNRNKNLDDTFRGITNSVSPLSIGTPIAMFSVGLIKKDSFLKRKAIYTAVSLVTSSLITVALKYSVNRPRPFITYPYLQKEATGGSPSFPSGHTSNAFALATSLSLSYPKWYVIVPSFAWAGLVGYSRMDLGVHYPSDVLAGAIVGAGSSWLCYKINQKLSRKYQ